MKTLDAPKNLTRNVLLGMTLGVIIASIFYYFQAQIPVDVFQAVDKYIFCLLYTSPSPRDRTRSRMPSSA